MNTKPADDERKASISLAVGCFVVIAVVLLAITVTIVSMYFQSIFTGGEEFKVNH